MSVLLFAMLDGSTLPLLRTFVEQHLNNGVVPRLLGFPVADGLTTPNPSTDDRKRLTILCELGICKEDFLALLQLLRTRDVTPLALVGARKAALLLGGLEAVDMYVAAPNTVYHPMRPQEDTLNRFSWMVAPDTHLHCGRVDHNGGEWSVTVRTEDQFRYYLRKPRSQPT